MYNLIWRLYIASILFMIVYIIRGVVILISHETIKNMKDWEL